MGGSKPRKKKLVDQLPNSVRDARFINAEVVFTLDFIRSKHAQLFEWMCDVNWPVAIILLEGLKGYGKYFEEDIELKMIQNDHDAIDSIVDHLIIENEHTTAFLEVIRKYILSLENFNEYQELKNKLTILLNSN